MTPSSLDQLFSRAILAILCAGLLVAFAPEPTPLPVTMPRIQSIPERVVSIAMEVGVPPALATQLASVESGMNPEAHHKDRNGTSWGVMQLNDRYWPRGAYVSLVRPDSNIRGGLTYLRTQLTHCHEDWACAVRRYRGLRP